MRSFSAVFKMIVFVSVCSFGCTMWAGDKTESELEEDLLTTLLKKRATNRGSVSVGNSSDLNFIKSDGKGEIGQTVVNDIGNAKNETLDFFASSKYVSWPVLAQRFDGMKKKIDAFEAKYKSELAAARSGQPAATNPTGVMPLVNAVPKLVAPMPVTPMGGGMPGLMPAQPAKPATMPISTGLSMPTAGAVKPAVAVMPIPVAAAKPSAGIVPLATMPVAPALAAGEEYEEVEVEEEETPTGATAPVSGGMPMAR